MLLASDQAGTTTLAGIFMEWGHVADACVNMTNACAKPCSHGSAQRGVCVIGFESWLWVWDSSNQSREALPRDRGKQRHERELAKRRTNEKKINKTKNGQITNA